ncbi:hypothetical protein JCM11491_004581 [Sporobolomyces phaffii]
MEETAPLFVERWRKSVRELESTFESPMFDTALATRELRRVSEELTERAGALPSYELGRCERELKSVSDKINEKKTKMAPKSKFSFKRSAAPSPSAQTPTIQRPPSTVTLPGPTTPRALSGPSIPRTSLTISSRSDQYLSSTSLPSSETAASEALLLHDLTNCLVDLLPTPNAQVGSSTSTAFPAVYLSGLKSCVVLLPKIDGSVMIHDCQGCTLVLGGHQFRMHDSSDCKLYLHTTSTPIIERCDKLVFDRYPNLFDPSLSATMMDAPPLFVQDFDYPFATERTPSPNWRLANQEDKAADWVGAGDSASDMRWTSSEGRRELWKARGPAVSA